MPIEVGIWRIDGKVERVEFTQMPFEEKLEDILAADISILDSNLMVIGRQVLTGYGKKIDLLAIDIDGNLVVIELKRDKTARDIVSQLLDYGSWVRNLKDEDITPIFADYLIKYVPESVGISLNEAFYKRFSVAEMPDSLNENHELVIVASELDNITERIVNYLADEYGVSINAVYFRFFRDQEKEYLSRVWLIDPGEAEALSVEKRGDEPWNDEYYVSFGESTTRNWADARQYGYIAAGGGSWYSRTLDILEVGGRIWVNVPGNGYVGVGRVTEKAKPINEFTLPDDHGKQVPIKQLIPNTPEDNKPEDQLEYYVRVEWISTVPLNEAVKEKGFFGNQNSAARPTTKKWVHTVARLKQRWDIKD